MHWSSLHGWSVNLWDLWRFYDPLVNVYIANWKSTTPNGKTHYFYGPCSIAMLVITRGCMFLLMVFDFSNFHMRIVTFQIATVCSMAWPQGHWNCCWKVRHGICVSAHRWWGSDGCRSRPHYGQPKPIDDGEWIRGIIPEYMAEEFRLVKYYNLPRWMICIHSTFWL